ncbi:WecB/TagA/CpsF family glycosyltransferase [Ornithinibacillus bavariensis]|uniref:WecB/TagA/CpsF family glycosyltransferase n=1 Tax=Ornithinibacillus bavariensis TaxID=545502 RepID=UPI000EDF5EB2|nr:glycosyltransferase [Ornithinibacillus sp.]
MGAFKTVSVMGIDFINTTKEEFLEKGLIPILNRNEKCFVVTANPEIVMKANEDHEFKRIIQSADFVVPDGAGILMAARHKKQPLQERIAGTDIMMDLLSYANEKGLSCFFLGASEAVNEKVVLEVRKQFPFVKIAGSHHGFFPFDDTTIVEGVRKANPDLVFVATGFPRQEKWISQNLDTFEKGIFIGVGGSFDVLSGEVKRAPETWIKLNLEWLYRLIKQPFRFVRVLKIFKFMFRIWFKRS